jgi:hypothetical protein
MSATLPLRLALKFITFPSTSSLQPLVAQHHRLTTSADKIAGSLPQKANTRPNKSNILIYPYLF